MKTESYPNVSQSFGIAGIMVLAMICLSPVLLISNKIMDKEASIFIYYVVAVGTPFGIVYSRRKRKTKNGSFNFRIENNRIIPFLVFATVALAFGIITPIGNLIPMPESFKKAMFELIGQNGFFSFLTLVVAAPVLEELIFRGIILDGLLNKYSPIKSILISSFLFGLVHLNPWQFITGFVIGIFSGWVYYKTRSLSLSMIIHASLNLCGFLMRHIEKMDTSSMDKTLVESYGGVLNLVLAITGSIVILLISIYYLNREFKKNSKSSNAQLVV